MGFDNECILNIQSLPGEYFCPVCRTLIYPNEALQSQCTHLYCKPCLAYVVATTRACPYDGYLVTETDSKPLVESNKSLAETIGKVAVRCLYYRSGCQWQGGLSDCVSHCAECTFGNSAVICNRCGTQILHRQVQEHGQTCPGMQPQGQQAESQAQDSKLQVQAAPLDQSSAAPAASAAAAPTAASIAAPTAVTAAPAAPSATAPGGQGQIQSNAVAYQQAAVQAQTPDQWYQQQQLQYQQYYQQYPGYDPYQQQYQQYAQYQQQAHPQYAQQQMPVQQQVIQGQQQPQYVMPQPQVQVHPQPQPQPQPHPQPHPQPQVQPQPQAMPQSHPPTHPQAQLRPQTQPYPQLQPHLQQPPQLQPQPQPQLQTQPVPHPQPHTPQPHLQQQYPPQSQPQPQIHAPVQQLHASAPQPHPHAQSLPLPPPHAQPGGQLLQPQPRPNHPQPQPHHLLQPSQIQATPQHLQSLPPQQHPHAQMQHPQAHPQQQPPPHSHPLPQHQQPHTQQQAQPMPQPHPFPQPQPQHPSAQAVSGHQSYPQPQPVQQYPMQVPTQQHNPQHPMQAQNQFPQPQTSQMRPPHSQLPVQVQQQPNMIPPQGPHASIGSSQSQAHHLVQQGQQMHQYPGMQLRAQPQGAHVQPHSGQPQQMHPQQPLHAQGHQYMQQQGPVQPQLQQSVAPAMSHEAQVLPGRSLMPNQGMQQPPYLQSPASNKPLLASVNQQSPNKSYPARGTVQHDQLARPESQVSASAALQSGSQPNPLVSEQTKQSADLKTSKSEGDFKSENREATAADVTEEMKSHKDSKVDEDGPETHLSEKDTKEPELKPPVLEDVRESSDAGKESSDKRLQNSIEPSSSAGTVQPENINSQGQPIENIAKNFHAPSQHQHILQQENNIHDLHRPSAGQGSYPVQPSSFGQSPKMRPPVPERMFPEHVPQPGPNQDRKLPGPPPQMQVFGQAPPPAQMGPPLRNIPETFPYQGQPSMVPHGPYPSQVPHPSAAGPDVPPSSTVPPGPFGHQQNYMPPPHAFGPTNFQGQQPLGRPGIGVPPSGPGGSAFGMENQMGPSHPAKSLEAERYGVEKAGFSGWQHEPRPPSLGPFGQPHAVHPGPMSTNGLPKERYGPVQEENFRPFPEQPKVYREERIVPSTLDLKRFEEDMKRFPRPDHLDREGRPPYDGHMSSTRPFDIPQPFGGPFPPSSGGLAANPTDYGDRLRPLGHHEDLGRRHDPLRSSGGEYTGSWQGKFGSGNQSHLNDFISRDPHGFDERSKALSLGRPYGPGSIRKDIDGTEVLPSRLGHVEPNGFGSIHNLRMGDPAGPGNLSTSRHGYPGETKAFNSFPIPGGMDSIEYSRMRKPGSMGLCRICKIDCETVEGLDLHSQTREHQKMAMHMVLSIKQENAKRQKLNYEGNVPFEDTSKARKPSFESHMNWA